VDALCRLVREVASEELLYAGSRLSRGDPSQRSRAAGCWRP